jgi:valyl-tRNA synthetase
MPLSSSSSLSQDKEEGAGSPPLSLTSVTLPKAYEPQSIEKDYYQRWLQDGCFTPPLFQNNCSQGQSSASYVIALPPPNVTGVLTMGHVLNGTIQDVLIRRARQKGYNALWIPGTDHAGIATQTKVAQLITQEGSSLKALGREQFTAKAMEWRNKHGGLINEQFQKLGVSCDWDRSVYTLDTGYSQAVLEAFVRLYEKGSIYKGKRLVNWCPVSRTALSDEEVIMKPNQGKLYFVRYAVVPEGQIPSPTEYITVATTRPETLMADVALAVNPEDSRYQHLIGKKVYRPFPREAIPIIADPAVDPSFGTGALKITPAHDKLDFEIAKRHQLPFIELIQADGTLNAQGEAFAGLDRLQARPLVVQKLKELGHLVDEKAYENTVGYSERANAPIETLLSEQWFLKYPKVSEAKAVVEQGLIQFWPKHYEKTYLHWLDKIQDWCISRQLWWGHRIPVWYKKGADRHNSKNWHVSTSPPSDVENWEQDEDVLDTWFSSWLWPFAIQGWPDKASMEKLKIKDCYPTHTLVTGPDIIFFWVARMIMASLEFNPLEAKTPEGCIPFKNVYFTGIIRDDKGQKMSKSLGNSPEPLDLIAQYGADGLRLGMISMAPQGLDIHFSQERLALGRNFCNKLWNACRFRQMSGPMEDNTDNNSILKRLDPLCMQPEDHFILKELLDTISSIDKAYEVYDFQLITQHLHRFFWSCFCDWYLELLKARPDAHKRHTLALQDFVLGQVLVLLYPFCPFISEKLAHTLGYTPSIEYLHTRSLTPPPEIVKILQNYSIVIEDAALESFAKLQETIIALRNLKAQYHLAARKDVQAWVKVDATQAPLLAKHEATISKLVGIADLQYVDALSKLTPAITPLGSFCVMAKIALNEGSADDTSKHLQEIDRLDKLIAINEAKLHNPSFLASAPAKVVEGAKKLLEEHTAKKAQLLEMLANIKSPQTP